MIKGNCIPCGRPKSQFVGGSQKGGSFIDKLINSGKLPELHYRSPFPGKNFGKKHSFTGPGTKLHERIDPITKLPLPHSQPVNEVDKVSYLHDLAYEQLTDNASRKIADNAMIDDLDAIYKDHTLPWQTRADSKLVGYFMRAKRLFGLGKKKQDIYCGVNKVPKGKKRGTMKECAETKQIRYYGIAKVDPKLVALSKKKKDKDRGRIVTDLAKLKGKIAKLDKLIAGSKDKAKVAEAKELRKKIAIAHNDLVKQLRQ